MRLNLEDAGGIRLKIMLSVAGKVLYLETLTALPGHEVERAPNGRQHADGQHVEFEQPQGFKVTFDDAMPRPPGSDG